MRHHEGHMQARSQPQEFFSIRSVANRWDVSTRTVRRIIDRGEISARHIGRQVRITMDEVLRYEREVR